MENIYERSLAGEITKEDALMLVNSNPFQLFDLADKLRAELVGEEVTFVVNRNIHITDHCMINCAFCSFKNNEKYEMSIDEILKSVGEAKELGATEICLFGGVMPYMTVDYYCDIISAIKTNYDIELHTLSPVEIYHAAKASEMSTKEVLIELKKVGLDTLTGASAEILVDSVRAEICPNKVTTAQWVKIIKETHEVGIPSTATMMYGTVETWADRIDHLLILRDIQRETGGFTEFVPMTFLSENNEAGQDSMGASGMEDLQLHAIARVILGPDIPNIQAAWIKMGTRMAQMALCCGANDLGGTMMEDRISLAAGASHGDHLPSNQMNNLVKAIGRVPVERTTTYKRV